MLNQLNKNTSLLNNLIQKLKNDKNDLVNLLKKILKMPINNIEFIKAEQYNKIDEYEFSIILANVFYENGKKEEIYLKMIKGGKIKESIFCFWSLLYEEYLEKHKDSEKSELKKAIITQVDSEENSSNLILTLNDKLNYQAEINLVELNQFAKKNKEYERWVKGLEIENDDILFIGRKMY